MEICFSHIKISCTTFHDKQLYKINLQIRAGTPNLAIPIRPERFGGTFELSKRIEFNYFPEINSFNMLQHM